MRCQIPLASARQSPGMCGLTLGLVFRIRHKGNVGVKTSAKPRLLPPSPLQSIELIGPGEGPALGAPDTVICKNHKQKLAEFTLHKDNETRGKRSERNTDNQT